jgi:hypothetical protein
MKTSFGAEHSCVPASHENPLDPGVWKKVLFPKLDLQAGAVPMVNWARLGVGKRFTVATRSSRSPRNDGIWVKCRDRK